VKLFDGQLIEKDDLYVKFRVASVVDESIYMQDGYGAQ
jgi:hypothetical protein